MNASERLADLLQPAFPLRRLGDGLFSVLPDDAPGHPYDARAAAYDAVVGSRLYNRLFWGTSPRRYEAFARAAVASRLSGWLLDAGCGTLRFTAPAYLTAHRPIVVLDRSLGMLERARDRVAAQAGGLPGHLVFLQADLLDLPFRPATMETVLCMGMLHLFDKPTRLVASLRALLVPGGTCYLTSLVENDRFGDRYLRFLHRAGEVAPPRHAEALQALLAPAFSVCLQGNMAYAAARARS